MNIFENNYKILKNTVVTLGKFDGLHEGHRKLIELTVEEAKRLSCESLVYTFNQNPKKILEGKEMITLISKQEKIEILKSMGVDNIVFEEFTQGFSKISPEDFIKKIIKDKLNAKAVIVGFNYRFGKGAKGDVELLDRIANELGIKVKVIAPVEKDGKVISSSMLRKELERI